jgi:hypothetical protein
MEGQEGIERQEGMQGQERSIEVDQLPQAVQETLQEDYEDWNASEAFLASDPEEGTFYKIKLENGEEGTKIVKISTDGEVIDEEDGDQYDTREQDGFEYTPVSFIPDNHKKQGKQGHQGQHGQHGMEAQQGTSVEIDQLPQAVQETLQEDYEDWRPADARLVTDPEEYEDGSFYKVRLNKTDDGEQETKIVKIASDGEVIDEEDLDDEGLFDGDDNNNENDNRRGRRY